MARFNANLKIRINSNKSIVVGRRHLITDNETSNNENNVKKIYRGIINTIKSNELCHYLPTRKVKSEANSTYNITTL